MDFFWDDKLTWLDPFFTAKPRKWLGGLVLTSSNRIYIIIKNSNTIYMMSWQVVTHMAMGFDVFLNHGQDRDFSLLLGFKFIYLFLVFGGWLLVYSGVIITYNISISALITLSF